MGTAAGRALVAAMVMALDERDAFLTRGYLVLQLDLPPCFNADLYARAQRQTAEPCWRRVASCSVGSGSGRGGAGRAKPV